MQNEDFATVVVDWYLRNKRELPWRHTTDPYKVWLSEIMLQQTRVAQGLPYYERFLKAYPTVSDLASATEEEVLKVWQGLGYYSRARNLHATARYVAGELGGIFPGNYQGLLRLKGVGPYTASAIASFCYGEVVPVFDGNVYRVLSRYFGLREPINGTAGRKALESLGRKLCPQEDIANYNQGIMEFGALQCKPKSPDCGNCPLSNGCQALKQDMVAELPTKLRKSPVKRLVYNYLVFRDSRGFTRLEQRRTDGIWPGLYQFPLWETEMRKKPEDVAHHLAESQGLQAGYIDLLDSVVHKLSHRHIEADFWLVSFPGYLNGEECLAWEDLERFPVPVLIERFLAKADFD